METYESVRDGSYDLRFIGLAVPGDADLAVFRIAKPNQYREVKVKFAGTLLRYWDMENPSDERDEKLRQFGELTVQLALERGEIELHRAGEEGHPAHVLTVPCGDQRTSYEDDLAQLKSDLEQARQGSGRMGFAT